MPVTRQPLTQQVYCVLRCFTPSTNLVEDRNKTTLGACNKQFSNRRSLDKHAHASQLTFTHGPANQTLIALTEARRQREIINRLYLDHHHDVALVTTLSLTGQSTTIHRNITHSSGTSQQLEPTGQGGPHPIPPYQTGRLCTKRAHRRQGVSCT